MANTQEDKDLKKLVQKNPFLNQHAYAVAVGKHHKQNIKFDTKAVQFANDAVEVMKRIKQYCRSQYDNDSVKNIASKFDLRGTRKQQKFFGKLAHTTPEQRKKIMAVLDISSKSNDDKDSNDNSDNKHNDDSNKNSKGSNESDHSNNPSKNNDPRLNNNADIPNFR